MLRKTKTKACLSFLSNLLNGENLYTRVPSSEPSLLQYKILTAVTYCQRSWSTQSTHWHSFFVVRSADILLTVADCWKIQPTLSFRSFRPEIYVYLTLRKSYSKLLCALSPKDPVTLKYGQSTNRQVLSLCTYLLEVTSVLPYIMVE